MLQLEYGSSSARVVCPHRDQAVPSATVTYALYDAGGSVIVSTGTATKGTFSRALATAAVAGDMTIVISTGATALTVLEPCIVCATDGQTETIVPIGKSGTTITLQDPLARGYAKTTTTVKSAWIYKALNISTTATYIIDSYYQAIFDCASWTDGPRPVLFRICRYVQTNPITYDDVRQWLETVGVMRDAYDDADIDDARDWAWEDVRSRLYAAQRDPDVLRDTDEVRHVGAGIAAAHFLMGHGMPERARTLWGDDGNGNIIGRKWGELEARLLWYDKDQDRARETDTETATGSGHLRRGL